MFSPFLIFPFHEAYELKYINQYILMGKDNDFSVFIKSGHVLFFLCCLFPFQSIRENTTHRIISYYKVSEELSYQLAINYSRNNDTIDGSQRRF